MVFRLSSSFVLQVSGEWVPGTDPGVRDICSVPKKPGTHCQDTQHGTRNMADMTNSIVDLKAYLPHISAFE